MLRSSGSALDCVGTSLSLRRHDPDQVRRVTALRRGRSVPRPAVSQPPIGAPLGTPLMLSLLSGPSRDSAPAFGDSVPFSSPPVFLPLRPFASSALRFSTQRARRTAEDFQKRKRYHGAAAVARRALAKRGNSFLCALRVLRGSKPMPVGGIASRSREPGRKSGVPIPCSQPPPESNSSRDLSM